VFLNVFDDSKKLSKRRKAKKNVHPITIKRQNNVVRSMDNGNDERYRSPTTLETTNERKYFKTVRRPNGLCKRSAHSNPICSKPG